MRQTGRAVRRHHVQRLKHVRKHYWGFPNRWTGSCYDLPVAPVEMDARQLGKVVHTPQLCSCLCCGNARHNTAGWTPTIQERRQFDQYREQVEEAQQDLDEDSEDQSQPQQ